MPRSPRRLEEDQYGSSGYYWKTTKHEKHQIHYILLRHADTPNNEDSILAVNKTYIICEQTCENNAKYILELLKGLMVQVETRVPRQIQFLKLGRQILR